MRDNYWDKDWTDYVLPVTFGIICVLGIISAIGLVGSLAGWW